MWGVRVTFFFFLTQHLSSLETMCPFVPSLRFCNPGYSVHLFIGLAWEEEQGFLLHSVSSWGWEGYTW